MPLLKPPSPKGDRVTLQLRVQKPFLELVELYAEFIAADKEYVITQPVNRLLKRDQEFERWLSQQNHSAGGSVQKNRPNGSPLFRDQLPSGALRTVASALNPITCN